MIYTVKLINDKETIVYNDKENLSENKITGTLHDSKNVSSTFDFNINGSIGKDFIQNRKTKVEVINNRDKVIFRGRILNNPSTMSAAGLFDYSFSAFSALDYLNDTVVTIKDNSVNKNLVTSAISWILTRHNEKVDASRKIILGNFNNTQTLRKDYKLYQTTLETLQEILEIAGGEIRLRYEDYGTVLEYTRTNFVTDYTDRIELSKNMVEISKSYDNADFATCIIPLGDEDDNGNRLNVREFNGGNDWYENTPLVEKYGRIFKANIYETNSIANLIMYGNVDTQNLSDEIIQYSAQAVDLSFLKENCNAIEIGKGYHLSNKLMNIEADVELIDLSRKIEEPYTCDLIFGAKRSRLTDYSK